MDRHPEEKRAKIKKMRAGLLGGIHLLQQFHNRFGYHGGGLRPDRHTFLIMMTVAASVGPMMRPGLIDRWDKIIGRDDITQLIVAQANNKFVRRLHVLP
jgi:hypothetical protein